MALIGRLNKYASLQAKEFDETTGNNPSINHDGTFYCGEFVENIGLEETTVFSAFDLLDDIYAITPSTKYNSTLILNKISYDIINDEFGISYSGLAGTGKYMSKDKYNNMIIYNEIDEISELN